MKEIYGQLARTNFLPDDVAAPILAGNVPPIEEIIMPLLIGAMDCEAMIGCDPNSTWNERRLARQCLILAFLLAIVTANTVTELCASSRVPGPSLLHHADKLNDAGETVE